MKTIILLYAISAHAQMNDKAGCLAGLTPMGMECMCEHADFITCFDAAAGNSTKQDACLGDTPSLVADVACITTLQNLANAENNNNAQAPANVTAESCPGVVGNDWACLCASAEYISCYNTESAAGRIACKALHYDKTTCATTMPSPDPNIKCDDPLLILQAGGDTLRYCSYHAVHQCYTVHTTTPSVDFNGILGARIRCQDNGLFVQTFTDHECKNKFDNGIKYSAWDFSRLIFHGKTITATTDSVETTFNRISFKEDFEFPNAACLTPLKVTTPACDCSCHPDTYVLALDYDRNDKVYCRGSSGAMFTSANCCDTTAGKVGTVEGVQECKALCAQSKELLGDKAFDLCQKSCDDTLTTTAPPPPAPDPAVPPPAPAPEICVPCCIELCEKSAGLANFNMETCKLSCRGYITTAGTEGDKLVPVVNTGSAHIVHGLGMVTLAMGLCLY